MTTYGPEFREISHCGGKITVRRDGSTEYSSSRPIPAAWFGVYALPQGLPVGVFQVVGMGAPFIPAAPHPACFSIFVGSDSTGLFGHECPACKGYWRSGAVPSTWALTCPYCGRGGETFHFLTTGQRRFVEAVCQLTIKALTSKGEAEHTIDLDKVVDDIAKTQERPSFYYSEEEQQNLYTCAACGASDDILGRYGYCSCCGTRNDFQELSQDIATINTKTRERLKTGERLEMAVPDAVGAFDSAARQYAKQLAIWVPMTAGRRTVLAAALFHNLRIVDDLRAWFDINLFGGLAAEDVQFIRMMFYRRHVHEHNGGEVDQRYLDESGDTSVRLKQALRETPETIFRTTGLVLKIGRNLHDGFHELFPPTEMPIKLHRETEERRRRAR